MRERLVGGGARGGRGECGRADAVTLRAGWALGARTVAVTFLDDAYGGSEAADRNPYWRAPPTTAPP